MVSCTRRASAARLFGSLFALCFVASSAGQAHAALSFALTAGPGLGSLPPATATAIMDGVTAAAAKWSGLIDESVTLKYTIDYDPMLPALGASFDVYMAPSYDDIKMALGMNVTSPLDGAAVTKLQPGPALKLWINDLFAGPPYAPYVDMDGSVNNMVMDVSRAHLKGLGILPGADGGPGADGTLKFGDAPFDFDASDGIDSMKYDFVGVAMHEIAHSLGFVSGVDTLTTLLPPPPAGTPGPMHATPMVTVLDLFRYSTDSKVIAAFVPDVSLPVPGFSPDRYLSFDGGATAVGSMSTGVGLAGDMKQAGHWKDDPTFALMDPELDLGFELTEAFDALLAGPLPPDLMALDVIGWTIVIVPEASAFAFGALSAAAAIGLVGVGRRRRGPKA